MNYLYCGDNLEILRTLDSESVDLIYIDPPFNSKRDYNLFFDDAEIKTQRVAFEDTWTLKNVHDSLTELHTIETGAVYDLLKIYGQVAPHAFPYLVMMSLRILELHRVLKLTGSFYLHCDPTMSHYLKTLCDVLFRAKNFRNEIIWHYNTGGKGKSAFLKKHDVLFWYTRSNSYCFNRDVVAIPRKVGTAHLRHGIDEDGREYYEDYSPRKSGKQYRWYLDTGLTPMDVWVDIQALNPAAKERLGYPTQKPKALLERILQASSNEGEVVLDAFCGCGTTIDAAEGLNRQWIGIDISPIATNLIERRLRDTYGTELLPFEVRGLPTDAQSAKLLWEKNPFAFQDWWITEFEAFSTTFGKKGADKGVDGIALYDADGNGHMLRAAFQVKGGKHVGSKDIDALLGAMEKHKCELGVFLTIQKPTRPMYETIALSGDVKVWRYTFPKLQSVTLEEFFQGKLPKLPSRNVTFRQAVTKGKRKQQMGLL